MKRLAWLLMLSLVMAGGYLAPSPLHAQDLSGGNLTLTGNITVGSGYAYYSMTGLTWDNTNYIFQAGNELDFIYAPAFGSTVFGYFSSAGGEYSFAAGYSVNTGGFAAATFGGSSDAQGDYSFAAGNSCAALGTNSAAFNERSVARAYDSFVVGAYNLGAGTETSWISTDPLFEVGNGTSSTSSDALVVYKNGNAWVQGTLSAHAAMRCAPSGDLSMGSFTAGTAP